MPAGKVTEESVYDRMGRLHNEGLDYVLERISEEAPFTRSGARKLPPAEEIRDMCDDFARMCGYVCPARTRAGSEVSDDFSFLSYGKYWSFVKPAGHLFHKFDDYQPVISRR